VASKIIHDDNIAMLQTVHKNLSNKFKEAFAIDGAVEGARRFLIRNANSNETHWRDAANPTLANMDGGGLGLEPTT
jgi:hypothetical protein